MSPGETLAGGLKLVSQKSPGEGRRVTVLKNKEKVYLLTLFPSRIGRGTGQHKGLSGLSSQWDLGFV